MSTIIQLIGVVWTKQSRGAPQSNLRNAVPESYSLGHCDLANSVYMQNIEYSEAAGFENPIVKDVKVVNEQQQRQNKLRLVQSESRVDIYSWGVPLREDYPKEKKIGQLDNNTWLRICGNVRVSWESTWAYHKFVYNIFYGLPENFDSVTQKTKAVTIYRDEVNLW